MTYRPYNTLKATGVEMSYTNNSGTTIDKLIPVKTRTAGGIALIDVSVEADAFAAFGVTAALSDNGNPVVIVTNGRIENITTTYAAGDTVYVSKLGYLTNVKPSKGAEGFLAGDFVIRVGLIVRNEANPSNKDLLLDISLVGQLG